MDAAAAAAADADPDADAVEADENEGLLGWLAGAAVLPEPELDTSLPLRSLSRNDTSRMRKSISISSRSSILPALGRSRSLLDADDTALEALCRRDEEDEAAEAEEEAEAAAALAAWRAARELENSSSESSVSESMTMRLKGSFPRCESDEADDEDDAEREDRAAEEER